VNRTANGRWGRYKEIGGERHKLCNGPLHGEDGAWLPMRSYWMMKSGTRAGKPMSRCIACERVYRGRDPGTSGLVETDRVMFIFEEIKRRIGKAEACRRLGVTPNLWYRLESRVYTKMYRRTVRSAMLLLRELRANDVVLSKKSIRHGALARGKKAKAPENVRDFYISQTDKENEDRKRLTGADPDARAKWRAQKQSRKLTGT
jgi:hypothetical protein